MPIKRRTVYNLRSFFFNVNLDKDYKQFPDRRRRATIFCTKSLTIQIIEIEASIDTGGAILVQS